MSGALMLGFTAQAQLPVSTTPENKNVVLEEFTGIYCVYCPDGHKRAQELADQYPGDVVLINIHTGSYANPQGNDPDFRTPYGAAIASQSGLVGYPAGTVNRRVFPGMEQNSNGGTAMSRSKWAQAAPTVLNEASYANVALEGNLNASGDVLTVNVELYFTGNGAPSYVNLNVAVLQDNVEGPQTGKNANPDQVLSNGNYNHQHMLRELLTGPWGELITTTSQGTLVQKTYSYNIPADINGVPVVPEDLKVVAFVVEGQQNIVTGANGPTGYVSLEEEAFNTFSVYPNPASEVLNLQLKNNKPAELAYSLRDISGKQLLAETFGSESTTEAYRIDVASLPAGVYFISVEIEGETSTQRVVIQK